MYPLSFSRLKNIEYGIAPFIAACVQPSKPSTKEMMLGRVIHRALLLGDYKTACVQELETHLYPDTIADMQKLVGTLPSGSKKESYEIMCASHKITTLASAKINFNPDNKDVYSLDDVDMIDGLVEVAGDRFKDGEKEKHIELGVLLGNDRITDIKTHRFTGKSFFQKACSEMWLEQLALYGMLLGQEPKEYSIYSVEMGEGFTNSQEFVIPRGSQPMEEARARVNRWIKMAERHKDNVLKAIELNKSINVKLQTVDVADSDFPIWFYKEGV
jgi:hypothetical protein